jgi:hypothetical protein
MVLCLENKKETRGAAMENIIASIPGWQGAPLSD